MASPAILVAVTDALGVAVVERLIGAGADVTALVSGPATGPSRELERLGARVVAGSPRSAGQLLEAGIGTTAALLLTANDDAENVDAALVARRLRPDLPLIVRLFDEALADYLCDTLTAVTVVSMSAAAAPVFADLATRAIASGRTRRGVPRRAARARPALRVDRVLVVTGLSALALIALSTWYFAHALALPWLDALYFVWTTVFTVGYGDITPRNASSLAKLGSMVLMVAGAAFVAVLYAMLSGWVVSRRIDALRGRVPVRARGHVIVAGAGNVGVRVARLLAGRGHRIVVVERDADNRHLSPLRAEGHHVIVADAEAEATLELAGVDRAATVLALTESDAGNVRIALAVRARCGDLPVVTRLGSPELSAHVAARHDGLAASSIAIGSEAFARAVLTACGASSGTRGAPEARS